MRFHRRSFFLFNSIILLFLIPSISSAENTQKQIHEPFQAGRVTINSLSFEIDYKEQIVTFSGNVEARRGDILINCMELFLYYKNDPTKDTAVVDKIVATGKVKILNQDGGTASAENAVYYQSDEKIVLTGSPKINQDPDFFIEGTRITLLLKENRSIVEGSEDNKARAILNPRE